MGAAMSQMGQSRRSDRAPITSGLPGWFLIADISGLLHAPSGSPGRQTQSFVEKFQKYFDFGGSLSARRQERPQRITFAHLRVQQRLQRSVLERPANRQ